MDLSHPGADLLRDSEAQALLVLSRLPDGASGREIARLSGKDSHASVLRALNRLDAIGLVDSQAVGTSTIYRLNRNHAYWDALLALLASPAKIEERIDEIVRSFDNDEVTAAVFGSYARREAGRESDIDILVVLPDNFSPSDREALNDRLSEELTSLTGNSIQVVDLSAHVVRTMARQADPLVESWLREARTIVGPQLNDVIRQASG